jgi:hypothetical protein
VTSISGTSLNVLDIKISNSVISEQIILRIQLAKNI